MCALIAFLNGLAWSIIMPPFQGRDEVDHFAYVAQLAETGTLPENGRQEGVYSPAESLVLEGLHYYQVRFAARVPSIASVAEQRVLSKDIDAHLSLVGSGEAGVATSEPPLYYTLELAPYIVGRGNVLIQLELMRLVGVILGAVAVVVIFLFLRETLPGVSWATTIGAVCVALQPQFAFMSGSVNPDTLLFTISAAIFLCLARAFRRGLSHSLAVVLGLLVAAGFLTKLNFVGFAAGVFGGLIALAVFFSRSGRRAELRSVAIAAGVGSVPVMLYVVKNAVFGDPMLGAVSGIIDTSAAHSPFEELSYAWEMYMPRIPGMTSYFKGMMTFKDIWFDRTVGLYGWMDTTFPNWVDNIALIPAVAILLLCCRELLARRDALQARLLELCTYIAIAVGVLVMIGVSSYDGDVLAHGYALGEPRYLLPMLALLGMTIALAVRGAGWRWAPAVGAAMVSLFLAHDVFSQLQVIARYYG
jgi:4-amino-4-deoxy-L-arabinose transferase-like glycosyltransferase